MVLKLNYSKEYSVSIAYAVAQGLYWMMVCCTVSLGSTYLSNRGYSTIGIGALFAMAYLVATLLQQVISVFTDSSSKINVVDVLFIMGAVTTLDLLFACFTTGKGFATGFTFFIGAMVATVIQPFLNALNFYIEKYDIKTNYGVARAGGSFCFFIMSLLAGNLMKAISETAVSVLGFLVSALFAGTIIYIHLCLKATGKELTNDYDPFTAKENDNFFSPDNIKSFVNKYKMFFLFLVALIGFIFGHLLLNNYLYQITVNVGGDEADVGGLLALQAIVELPAMIFFSKLKDRLSSKQLLMISAVFYFIKIFVVALAASVGMLYVGMLFQAVSFAIYIPASVHFVDELMPQKDAVKGQAFVTIAMTIGNLVTSLFGGFLFRFASVSATLWISVIITLCGTILAIYSLSKIE